MSNKMIFAETLNDLDNSMPIITDRCFIYGSVSGCDKYCPVYQEGKCELQEENKKIFESEK